MSIFSSVLEILYKIEKQGGNLHVKFRNWTWWYLENIIKVILPGMLLTLASTIFVSNGFAAILGGIFVGIPFMFLMIRVQFEFREIQQSQQLSSIKFTSENIILEPIKNSKFVDLLLERPLRSGEYYELPLWAIHDFTILTQQSVFWGDQCYGLYAICVEEEEGVAHEVVYPISPTLAKIEQVEEFSSIISNFYDHSPSNESE
jgi:hypothetical protein